MFGSILAARVAAVVLAIAPVFAVWSTLPSLEAPAHGADRAAMPCRVAPCEAPPVCVKPRACPAYGTPATAPAAPVSDPVRTVRGPRRPCASEDATRRPCVWDARHRGNGRGSSFIVRRDHSRVMVTHARAHALLFGGAR